MVPQIAVTREVRRLAEKWHLAGLADFRDVFNAEREILSAETALVQTESARLNDLVMLFKVLGDGWKPGG
jgi:outer membrane protein TolC